VAKKTETQVANHHHLARAVEAFIDIDKGITLFQMQAFLLIATNEGQTQKWIEEKLDTSNATASRVLSRWSEYDIAGKPGFGFIRTDPDPTDRRFRIVSLTARGRTFLAKIRELLGDSNGDEAWKSVAG